MPLPNTSMDFSAFDVLTAAQLDDLVENIEALADGSGLDTDSIDPENLVTGTGTAWPMTAWTPTWTGFSTPPTTVAYYKQVGKHVILHVRSVNNGTSNATSTGISNAPITSRNITDMFWFGSASIIDNGVAGIAPGRAYIPNNSTVISIGPNWASDSWTGSGGKAASFTLIYEAP